MGSDVVFGSLYLDRWLRSSWCLDIAMLLLLGVASLMCRSDSVCVRITRIVSLMMIDLVSPDFLTYHTFGATLEHIPFHLEVHGSSRTCAIITYWMLIETWTWLFTLRSLWDPPSRVRTSRHLDSIMPLHLGGTFLGMCAWFSYGFGRPLLHVRWQMISCRLISDLSCIRCPYWGIFFRFGWDLRTFMEVTCAMMDVFMTFVLRTYRAPDAILGPYSVLENLYGSSQRSHVRG